MNMSYFRALLGTGGIGRCVASSLAPTGDIISSDEDIWVSLGHQVPFPLCLLPVLGIPICSYVSEFMSVFV